ncbi:MAG: sigma-70 family RNA polymerase sigma factor [Phycisphaeraceae bacterium]|nr:sigma-70 family RNA polymerase sigma factor [Phycisphaeraceae bacterium]
MENGILQRIASGEASAVQACIDRYSGLVWSLARRFCPSPADAEDAVQEIFLDVWRSASRFDASVASETTFVAMIARRRLIDRGRRSGRTIASLDNEDGTTPVADRSPRADASLGDAEDAQRAAIALESLKPEQQKVLRLSIYQGLSHERIADATGMPLGTVKTHVRRGLIRLREILGGTVTGSEGAP